MLEIFYTTLFYRPINLYLFELPNNAKGKLSHFLCVILQFNIDINYPIVV